MAGAIQFAARWRRPLTGQRIIVEACVDSATSARRAGRAGVDRLEVCADLDVEGRTPSPDLLDDARRAFRGPIFAMLRPRAGDFRYDETDASRIEEQLAFLLDGRVDGVVFGALTDDGDVDDELCRRVLDGAGALPVTFHRAFDHARNPMAALEAVIALGFARILTSGGQETALAGSERLRELVTAADGRIAIVAGGGIRASHVRRLVEETGVAEVHLSGRPSGGRDADEAELRRVVNAVRS